MTVAALIGILQKACELEDPRKRVRWIVRLTGHHGKLELSLQLYTEDGRPIIAWDLDALTRAEDPGATICAGVRECYRAGSALSL